MAMTRRDFKLVAKVINQYWRKEEHISSGAFDRMVNAMADGLEATNPNFNRLRFLETCWASEDQ